MRLRDEQRREAVALLADLLLDAARRCPCDDERRRTRSRIIVSKPEEEIDQVAADVEEWSTPTLGARLPTAVHLSSSNRT